MMRRARISLYLFALVLLVLSASTFERRAAAEPDAVRVFELIQTPGAAAPQRLRLAAGRYIFRVRNHGVDHAVSLRVSRIEPDGTVGPLIATLTRSILDGEVAETAAVALLPGRYTYRSAENPTPHYFIDVD